MSPNYPARFSKQFRKLNSRKSASSVMDSPGPVPWASLTHRTGAKRRKIVRERCLLFETFITFCGIVGLRATVLRSAGGKASPHPRACALSCPPSPGPASCLGQSLHRTDQNGSGRARGCRRRLLYRARRKYAEVAHSSWKTPSKVAAGLLSRWTGAAPPRPLLHLLPSPMGRGSSRATPAFAPSATISAGPAHSLTFCRPFDLFNGFLAVVRVRGRGVLRS
jgi:hypothetical protein